MKMCIQLVLYYEIVGAILTFGRTRWADKLEILVNSKMTAMLAAIFHEVADPQQRHKP